MSKHANSDWLAMAAVIFYALTVGLAIVGFALAATRHAGEGAFMGATAVLAGVLALTFAYASTKSRTTP